MRLTRIFINVASLVKSMPVPLTQAQQHYLKNVMRIRRGDFFLLFNRTEGEWLAKFENEVAVLLEKKRESESLYDYSLTLCICVPKLKSLKNVIRQSTELGVDTIQLVHSLRGENKIHDIDKLHVLAIEAAQQSERLSVPEIIPPIDFSTMITSYNNLILCDERLPHEESKHIPKLQSYSIIVGPEGGFSEEELSVNAYKISLGKTILRTDTAVVAAISHLRFTRQYCENGELIR